MIIFCSPKLLGQHFNISYKHDTENALNEKTIIHQEFKEYTNPINSGLNNGVYWFKIHVKKEEPFILKINNSRIFKTNLYTDTKELKTRKKTRYTTYLLPEKAGVFFYLKVVTDKEAFIPIDVLTVKEFEESNSEDLLMIGIYYGIAIMILMFNLFHFIKFKDYNFFKYIIFNFLIGCSLFYSDGGFTFYVNSTTFNINIEIVLHILVAFLANVFFIDYLKIRDKKYLNIQYVILVVLIILAAFYFTTNRFFYFVLVECFCLLSLTLTWCFAFMMYHKNKSAKILTWAYLILFIAMFNFYLFRLFGFPMFPNSIYVLKIGSIVEMLFFSYTLIYNMSKLKEENKQIKQQVFNYSNTIKQLSEEKKKVITYSTFNKKEQDILKLLKENKSNTEIAEELFITVDTVKYHLKKIYKKLGVKNRKEIKNYPF